MGFSDPAGPRQCGRSGSGVLDIAEQVVRVGGDLLADPELDGDSFDGAELGDAGHSSWDHDLVANLILAARADFEDIFRAGYAFTWHAPNILIRLGFVESVRQLGGVACAFAQMVLGGPVSLRLDQWNSSTRFIWTAIVFLVVMLVIAAVGTRLQVG